MTVRSFLRSAGGLCRRLPVAALLAALTLPGMALAEGPLPDRRIVLQQDVDLPGGDLAPIFETTEQACIRLCLADRACTALTYNARSRACFPKGVANPPVPFAGALSGQVTAPDPAVAQAAADRVAGAGAWLRLEADLDAARRQAQELGRLYPGTGEDVAALRARLAEAAGDPQAQVRWQGAVTAATDSPDDWDALSAALLEQANLDNENRETLAAAQSAALNAWLRSAGPAVPSLTRWAEIAEKLDRGLDGLGALRHAESHGGGGDPRLAEMIPAFQERHGFRVTDNQMDSDALDPRACAFFSAELAAGVDYRPYVALPDPAMAVETEGSQLCVTGLTRGSTLKLTLRPGLPAADGQTLRRPVELSMYVRDRAPMARFGGRAYVLPSGGDQGLTLYTVNTGAVDLKLYRMSDRNLVRALRDEIFAAPLDDWGAQNFTTYMGEEIWTGQASVAPAAGGGAAPVNAEIATRLDLTRTAGPLTPGIYALTAQVAGSSTETTPAATQWFMISDLGLASWSGTDGLTVAVRGLSDAAARAGIDVALVSRGNAVLATAATDDQGVARFASGLTRGTGAAEPALVTATLRQGGEIADMGFLSLIDPEFDLSDRGVEGNPPAPPIDVFAATDRGAYRAGEIAHATILTRDDRGRAIEGLPLTAVVLRPDGVEHARMLAEPAGAGGYTLAVPIPDTAPRGLWRVDFRVEDKGRPLASAKLLVEDFRPERIAFDLALPDTPQPAAQPVQAAIDARWLFGAPAAGLPVEGELRLTPATTLPGFEGYVFGRHDDDAAPEVVAMPAGVTDAEGRFAARVDLPPALAQAARPWEAQLTLTVREGAGRPVERRDSRLVLPARTALGIRPGFDGGTVPQGAEARFQVVAVGPDLTPQPARVEWVLNRIDTTYQWYAMGGDWNWEPITRRERIANGALDLAGAPGSISAPVDWGSYELVVTGPDGARSSTTFEAGWGAATTGTDTPDRLSVSLDRPGYAVGDTARVTLRALADGVAVVSVLSNRVISMQTVPVTAGDNTVDLPVTEDWGAGAYVAVSAIRPVAAGTAELSARTPIRALGIAAAHVDPGDRALQATLTAPPQADPRGTAQVTLAVAGAAAGETVNATIWAVDQGILNLTGYQPPSASDHYLGQRRLGVGMRDLYGRLILPGGAADGTIRAGGDASSMQTQAPPPTEKLMAWFSGPLTLGPDGATTVTIPLPDFNGELRIMALVWTGKGVGQTDTTMLVRDPVVMTATVPAFLAPGDVANAHLALTHVDGPAGEVALSVENLSAVQTAAAEAAADQGSAEPEAGVTLATADLPASVTLADQQAVTVPLTLTAPDTEGTAMLRVSARLPDGRTVSKDLTIPVQRMDAAVSRRIKLTLAPGAAQTVDLAPLGRFQPGTGRITLTSGAFARLNVPGALAQLAAYPYGCTEQLSSGALPQLYAQALMPEGMPTPPGIDPRTVDPAIAQVLTRQASDGSFGLWQPDSGDRWLTAYVTDFLGRARAQGHAVPDPAFRLALQALQNGLNAAAAPEFADSGENAATAYAAYVLAREGQAVVSDLRYYVDTGAAKFDTPLAAAQLGAALAAYGDQPRADIMFRHAQALAAEGREPEGLFRADYGTALRDLAGVLALAAEAGSQAVDRDALAVGIASRADQRDLDGAPLSTQEAGWITLAAQALSSGKDAGGGLTLSGAALSAPVQDLGDAAALPPVQLANSGSAPVEVTLGTTAVPVDPPPAGGTAFAIARSYFTADGQPVDPASVPLGTRLVAVIEVDPIGAADGRLIVTDPLPGGFEIDNPNLLTRGETGDLDWLGDTAATEMAEFRQDRFAAAVTAIGDSPLRLAYRVRAVTPGVFRHPAATVEDMYRPDRRAWTASGATTITR